MASNEPEFDEELKRRRTGELFQVESELVQAAGTSMEEEIKMAEQGDGAGEEGESSADVAINSSPIKRRSGRPQGSKKLKVQSELVQAAGTSMEEEIKMAETEQGDGAGEEGESSADSSPIKRRSGMPQGSKKLKVCVTDIKLMELVSGISNGGSTQPQKGRGSPKLSITTHTEEEEEGSGDNQAGHAAPERKRASKTLHHDTHGGGGGGGGIRRRPGWAHSPREEEGVQNSPSRHTQRRRRRRDQATTRLGTPPQRGRGRPKLSITTHTEEEEEEEGEEEEGSGDDQAPDSVPAHRAKGSPKGTPRPVKETILLRKEGDRKSISAITPLRLNNYRMVALSRQKFSSVKRKRGRPKGSPNKKPRLQTEVSSEEDEEDEEEEEEVDTDGSVSSPTERVGGQLRSTRSNGISDTPQRRRGRPRKSQATDGSQEVTRGRLTSSPPPKRGRPRKNPLPTTEERNKPRVWKQLGRPRKYPRPDPPEGDPTGPRRGPGRPRKTESKKGAHLRKRLPFTSSPSNSDDGSPRKSRQALSPAKNEAVVPRKRGRPKSSANANKASVETELDRASPAGDSTAVEEEPEAEPAEEEEEEQEHDVQTTSTEHVGDTEEMLIEQNANFEVSDQA
ncbi:serine/arginine repetitive matrix protein 1-like [Hippoglossus hippoglossus]|uniref:serine/arginine repetitive matrix protein 1-like n=1 Tax=Hippoglossus hippoglossus TaxID=8267 RepID=UPI00148DD315|nr:serine/arginine repetitive matrix protein 1-like [Hippoglossus hippoglossus]